MPFLEKIRTLIYRPSFFEHRQFGLKKALRFYALLLLIFIGARIFLALPGLVSFYQDVLFSDFWGKQTAIITNLFPETLELTMQNGVVSTNSEEPVVIPLPKEWNEANNDSLSNLLVIDTSKSVETSDFSRQDTLIILGKSTVGFHNQEKNEFRIYDLEAGTGTFTITKEQFVGNVIAVSEIVWWVVAIFGIIWPLLLYFTLFVSYLLYLLFGALVVWLGARWRGHRLRYGEAYVAGIFLLPVPFCYEFLSSYWQGNAGNIPFAFSVILLIMTLANFPNVLAEKERVSTPKESTTGSEVEKNEQLD